MSAKQPNVEILKAFLDAFNRHDLDAIMDFFVKIASSICRADLSLVGGGVRAKKKFAMDLQPAFPACQMSTREMTGTLSAGTADVRNGS